MEYTLPKEESMPRQQKTYTREFKLEAVQLVKSSGKPLSQVARDLLISDSASDPRLWMGIRSQLPSPLAARFTATGSLARRKESEAVDQRTL